MKSLRFRLGDWLQEHIAGPDGAYAGGRRYARKRNFEVALAAFAQAERQYSERLGPTSPRVIDAMAQRAWCLVALGRLREGLELYDKALAAKEARPDSSPPPLDQLRRLAADARQRVELADSAHRDASE